MSNFQVWKAAKFAFDETEDEYCDAHNAVIAAGKKRSEAWDRLIAAARDLNAEDQVKAKKFESLLDGDHP